MGSPILVGGTPTRSAKDAVESLRDIQNCAGLEEYFFSEIEISRFAKLFRNEPGNEDDRKVFVDGLKLSAEFNPGEIGHIHVSALLQWRKFPVVRETLNELIR